MRSLRELRLILNSLLGSMFSLMWAIVMMLLVFFMFGLVFVQSAAGYVSDSNGSLDSEEYARLAEHFGSVEQAMLGLFMATTGGNDWSVFYDALRPIGPQVSLIYLFYVAFSQIALLNILTGIFVENAMRLAEPDRQAVYADQQKQYNAKVAELQGILEITDRSHDG